MFSTSQDKTDFKEEDEKSLLGMVDDLDEAVENENQQSLNPELAEQTPIIEEIEDTEKETGTEEVIEIDKVRKTLIIYFIARIIIYSFKFFNIHNAFFTVNNPRLCESTCMIVTEYTTD